MKTRWIRSLSLILALFIFCPVLVAESAEKSTKKTSTQVDKKSKKKSSKKSTKKKSKKKSSKKSSKSSKKEKSPKKSAAAIEAESYMLPSVELTVGFLSGDGQTEGIGDILIPIWNPGGNGLLFVNPRTAFTDHDEEEVNIGVGYRQLLPKQNIIVGANVYYDYRDTGHSNYDQWGVGIEMLSTWVDARANYYDPSDKKMVVGSYTETETTQSSRNSSSWSDPYAEEHVILQDYTVMRTLTTTTDTQTYEQYEQALGGFDWEIGLRLPLPVKSETVEARIFGGMYDFDRDFGDDAKGWKARAEIRVLSSLFLDGGVYENDDLTGSDWFAGARWTVPLDLAKVSQGRNPFSTAEGRLHGKARTLRNRLTEMVMRDPQIRLEQSKFLENKALATTESTTSSTSTREIVPLMSDINFVDGDAPAGGDGTAEAPRQTIQDGVDNAFGALNVYVFDAASTYEENVALSAGIQLYGSGSLIELMEGKTFGNGIAPVVDGMGRGPTVTLANNTLVRGFTVRNTDTGSAPIMVDLPVLGLTDVSRVGILGNDVTELTLTENTLRGNSYGALMTRQGDFNATFSGNLAQDNDLTGLRIAAEGNSGSFNALIENSIFQDNGGDGANLFAETYDAARVQVQNSHFSGNVNGLLIVQSESLQTRVLVSDCVFTDNAQTGLRIQQRESGVARAEVSSSAASRNGDWGIVLQQQGGGTANATVYGITVNDNGEDGLELGQWNNSDNATAHVIASTASGNDDNGFELEQRRNDISTLNITDCRSTGNTDDGFEVEQRMNDTSTLNITGSQATENSDEGFNIDQRYSDTSTVNITGSQATGNSDEGFDIDQRWNDAAAVNITGSQATGNTDHGFEIDQRQSEDSALITITGVSANQNGDDGFNIDQRGGDGSGPDTPIGQLEISDTTANDNLADGFDLDQSGFLTEETILTDSSALRNGDDGINASQTCTENALYELTRVTANDNDTDGIDLQQMPDDSSAQAVIRITDAESSRNGSDGIGLNQSESDTAEIELLGITADENAGSGGVAGIHTLQEDSADVSTSVDLSSADNNSAGGILIEQYEFTSSALADLGSSTATGNTGTDIDVIQIP